MFINRFRQDKAPPLFAVIAAEVSLCVGHSSRDPTVGIKSATPRDNHPQSHAGDVLEADYRPIYIEAIESIIIKYSVQV